MTHRQAGASSAAERSRRCRHPGPRCGTSSTAWPPICAAAGSAAAVAALIDQLDLRDVTLVTHSTSAAEAWRYLARHGEDRVAKLVSIAPGRPCQRLTDDNPEGMPEKVFDEAFIRPFSTDRPRWFADRAQGYFATHLGNHVSPALIDNEVRRCLSASPHAALEVARTNFYADQRAEVQAISIPTLILHGVADQSNLIDWSRRQLVPLITHSKYKEYPTAGHGIYITHAQQLNADIHEFVKS